MRTGTRVGLSALAVLGLAAGLLAAGTALGSPRDAPTPAPAAGPAGRPGAAVGAGASDPLSQSIASLQAELANAPRKFTAWSELGLAYVQQARLTADPTYYGKADGAFATSLKLRPTNNDAALTGQATLASARHDFAGALALTDRSLKINAYSPTTWAVRTDALNELGRYTEAEGAVQRLLDLRPGGVDALTRASYIFELHGNVPKASQLLQQAANAAVAPADTAFAQYYLGELAFNTGKLTVAREAYESGLAADPNYLPLAAGRAQVLAATGDPTAAAGEYNRVVDKLPTTQYLLAYGELLQASGQSEAAQEQYAVLRATSKIYTANGQDVDTELALFQGDHGTPAAALATAEKAYAKRSNAILTQEAYAWALHVSGRDREALPIARASTRLGLPNPSLYYRLGVIEAAVGNPTQARTALRHALDLNPKFSPLLAPKAQALLARLG